MYFVKMGRSRPAIFKVIEMLYMHFMRYTYESITRLIASQNPYKALWIRMEESIRIQWVKHFRSNASGLVYKMFFLPRLVPLAGIRNPFRYTLLNRKKKSTRHFMMEKVPLGVHKNRLFVKE